MNWKKWGAILAVLSLVWMWQQWPDGKLHVVFCDVGQGDAALVVLGSFQALIDTGPSESLLLECLGENVPFWDRQIELVFISHPQKDHNGAMAAVLSRYSVGKVIEKVRRNDVYRYKELYFDILMGDGFEVQSQEMSGADENEDSMVVFVRYFGFSALFTADIGEVTELALLESGVLEKISVLKVPHHGSKFSSSFPFLSKLRPVVSVVSVGEKNSYGHPNGDTLIRLEQVESKIFRTDKSGDVEIVFDQTGMEVFTEK